MILAEATTWLPGADGMIQLGMLAAAGIATLLLLPGDKAKTEGKPAKSWFSGLKLPFVGSSTPSVEPTVGEAYELFTRLKMLSATRVSDYGDHLDESLKHLTWLKGDKKPEGPTVAAP